MIVPPIPEKNVVQKYQMTQEFVSVRKLALQVFINRVVCPALPAAPAQADQPCPGSHAPAATSILQLRHRGPRVLGLR